MDRTSRLLAAIDADSTLLDRLLLIAEPRTPCQITSPEEAVATVSPYLAGHHREHLVGVALDRRHHILAVEVLSIGNDIFTIVCPRTIFRWALKHGAQAIVLAHNHPSGDPAPSPQDHEVTHRVAEAGRILQVRVLDHLIVGDGGWSSLAEQDLLPGWPDDPPLAY